MTGEYTGSIWSGRFVEDGAAGGASVAAAGGAAKHQKLINFWLKFPTNGSRQSCPVAVALAVGPTTDLYRKH